MLARVSIDTTFLENHLPYLSKLSICIHYDLVILFLDVNVYIFHHKDYTRMFITAPFIFTQMTTT